MKKPVVAYIAGLSAPKGRRMGPRRRYRLRLRRIRREKVEILKSCGVTIDRPRRKWARRLPRVLQARKAA